LSGEHSAVKKLLHFGLEPRGITHGALYIPLVFPSCPLPGNITGIKLGSIMDIVMFKGSIAKVYDWIKGGD